MIATAVPRVRAARHHGTARDCPHLWHSSPTVSWRTALACPFAHILCSLRTRFRSARAVTICQELIWIDCQYVVRKAVMPDVPLAARGAHQFMLGSTSESYGCCSSGVAGMGSPFAGFFRSAPLSWPAPQGSGPPVVWNTTGRTRASNAIWRPAPVTSTAMGVPCAPLRRDSRRCSAFAEGFERFHAPRAICPGVSRSAYSVGGGCAALQTWGPPCRSPGRGY